MASSGSDTGSATAKSGVSLPFANVAEVAEDAGVDMSAHHGSWMNWRPQDNEKRDADMVNSVLGTVANLRGSDGGLPPVPAAPQLVAPPAALTPVEVPHVSVPVSLNAAAVSAPKAAAHAADPRDLAVSSSLAADEAMFGLDGSGSLEAMSEPQPVAPMRAAPQ